MAGVSQARQTRGMPEHPTADPAPEQDAPEPTAEADDAKARFREALERKKQNPPDSVSDPRHGEAVHGRTDTHQHGGKREFRRKAGP